MIGKRFHRIKVKSTLEIHDSGYYLLAVYGKTLDGEETYIGKFDVINIEYDVMKSIALDSDKPDSVFEIAHEGTKLELISMIEGYSIIFKIVEK